MKRSTKRSWRIVLVLIVLMALLGGLLLQSKDALAGFGSSPGFLSYCACGKHFDDATLT